jgi:soluble lytic murein transglycosylase-like protein
MEVLMVVSFWERAYAGAKSLLVLMAMTALGGMLLLPLGRESLEPARAVVAGPIQPPLETPEERERRVIADFIAKRYRVSEAAVADYVAAAYRAGQQYSLDPLLILAVMAVESRYNPVAESAVGAKGLMQIMPKYHLEKVMDRGGEEALLEPEINIEIGAQILREYQRRFGDTETALQMYAGAFDEPSGQYAAKVFAERARLQLLRQKTRKQQSA